MYSLEDISLTSIKNAFTGMDIPSSSSGLTLLRLRMWMQEPLDRYIHTYISNHISSNNGVKFSIYINGRMCLMAQIADCAIPLSGGGLASRIHGYTFHGDKKHFDFTQSIMTSVSSPIYKMIIRYEIQYI